MTSLEDVIDLIKRGAKNRHIGSTLMNSESSRSHSIFTTTLQLFHKSDETTQTRTSKFHIVDLAGSEKIDKQQYLIKMNDHNSKLFSSDKKLHLISFSIILDPINEFQLLAH